MKRSPILRKTPLGRTSFLSRMSEAQRVRKAEWSEVTRQRAADVEYICEAGIEGVCDGYGAHGHHVIRRSQGGPNTIENCRWVCKSDHLWIHSNPSKAISLGLLKSATASGPAAFPPRAEETTCDPPVGASRAALAVAAPPRPAAVQSDASDSDAAASGPNLPGSPTRRPRPGRFVSYPTGEGRSA